MASGLASQELVFPGVSRCGPAIGLSVDITSRESVRSMLEQVILAYGGVANIIITAGIFVPPDKQGYIPDDKWALTYAINMTGPYLVADEAKKIWRAQCIHRGQNIWWDEYFYAILEEEWHRAHA